MIKLITKILYNIKAIRYFNFRSTIKLNGKRFNIPIFGELGLGNIYMNEPWMLDLLKKLIQLEDKKFVDVGVNTGQTLLKLRSVSGTMEYIGFEPNPSCIYYLYQLIKANRFKNIIIVPAGVSLKAELAPITYYHASETDTSASIINNFRPSRKIDRKEIIPLFPINSIRNTVDLEQISILKIDVEGAEWEVIKSFEEEIMKHAPLILLEILPVYNADNKERMERQNKIQDLFKRLSFTMFRIKKDKRRFSGLMEMKEIEIHGDLDFCDYIIVPPAKLENFRNHFEQWIQ